MRASIFIIDSSPAVRRMVEQISSPHGYEVIGFQDGPAALEAARRTAPALIIVDYHLAKMTFSGFCKEVAKLDSLAETVLMSLIDVSDRLDEQHLRALGVRCGRRRVARLMRVAGLRGCMRSRKRRTTRRDTHRRGQERSRPPSGIFR